MRAGRPRSPNAQLAANLGYNRHFFRIQHAMEAEQLNALANRLEDLGRRTAELRRYL